MLEDEDLLQILLFTKPSELSSPHVDNLRDRLAESSELRSGLREMDESRRLGLLERIDITQREFDRICKEAESSSMPLGNYVVVALILFLAAFGIWYVATQHNNDVANGDPNSTTNGNANSTTSLDPTVADKGNRETPTEPKENTPGDPGTEPDDPGDSSNPNGTDNNPSDTNPSENNPSENGRPNNGEVDPPAPVDIALLPKFEQVCFGTFDVSKTLPTQEVVEQWFEKKKGWQDQCHSIAMGPDHAISGHRQLSQTVAGRKSDSTLARPI